MAFKDWFKKKSPPPEKSNNNSQADNNQPNQQKRSNPVSNKLFPISRPYGYNPASVEEAIEGYTQVIENQKKTISTLKEEVAFYKSRHSKLEDEYRRLQLQLNFVSVPSMTEVQEDYIQAKFHEKFRQSTEAPERKDPFFGEFQEKSHEEIMEEAYIPQTTIESSSEKLTKFLTEEEDSKGSAPSENEVNETNEEQNSVIIEENDNFQRSSLSLPLSAPEPEPQEESTVEEPISKKRRISFSRNKKPEPTAEKTEKDGFYYEEESSEDLDSDNNYAASNNENNIDNNQDGVEDEGRIDDEYSVENEDGNQDPTNIEEDFLKKFGF